MKRFYLILVAITLGAAVLAAQTPTISNGGVVNGASFQGGVPITPGSLITIFGTQLASKTAQADTIPLSTSLGGVTVQFVDSSNNTTTAPLLYVQPDNASTGAGSQINAQLPWSVATSGTVNVIVSHDGVSSAPTPVTIGQFSPGVFSSGGRAIAVNPDGTLAWPSGAVAGLTTHPAKPGDTLIVYATGLGTVDSPVTDGQNSLDKLRRTLVTPVVMIGGITASVGFSGLSPQFVGVNQLNVTVPNTAAGDAVPLQLQLGGITTADTITIAVSNP